MNATETLRRYEVMYRPGDEDTPWVELETWATTRDDALAWVKAEFPGHERYGARDDIDYGSPEAIAEFEAIWEGTTVGFSQEDLTAELAIFRRLLVDLNEGTVPPRRIVGTGYRNSRKVALDYLHRSIAAYEEHVATRGRTAAVNRANVRVRVLTAQGRW